MKAFYLVRKTNLNFGLALGIAGSVFAATPTFAACLTPDRAEKAHCTRFESGDAFCSQIAPGTLAYAKGTCDFERQAAPCPAKAAQIVAPVTGPEQAELQEKISILKASQEISSDENALTVKAYSGIVVCDPEKSKDPVSCDARRIKMADGTTKILIRAQTNVDPVYKSGELLLISENKLGYLDRSRSVELTSSTTYNVFLSDGRHGFRWTENAFPMIPVLGLDGRPIPGLGAAYALDKPIRMAVHFSDPTEFITVNPHEPFSIGLTNGTTTVIQKLTVNPPKIVIPVVNGN